MRSVSPEEYIELEKLRADYPAWDFMAVSRRWVAEKRMEDGLIIVEKADPKALRARVEHYNS